MNNPTSLLLEVKRFAVHDGPGVRTVLFLKGCSLKCRWCHNPESISRRPQLAYYEHKCINCGECLSVCPVNAHQIVDGKHLLDRDKCTACGACEEVCLGQALKLFGREVTVEEAVKLALEDRDFYETDGGITVSGGEPLLQAEFCAELFKLLKPEGIHCAVDTSGAVSWDSIKTVLPHTDMFLYDLKHVDEQLHREYIGSTNKLILRNLKALSECNVPIEIRTPVIPGFNANQESMTAIGKFLSSLNNITAVRLLPYHPAKTKFKMVGHADSMGEVTPPTQAQMEAFAACLKEFGLNIN